MFIEKVIGSKRVREKAKQMLLHCHAEVSAPFGGSPVEARNEQPRLVPIATEIPTQRRAALTREKKQPHSWGAIGQPTIQKQSWGDRLKRENTKHYTTYTPTLGTSHTHRHTPRSGINSVDFHCTKYGDIFIQCT